MKKTLALLTLFVAAGCRASDSYQTMPMPDQAVELERASRGRVYVARADDVLWQRVPLLVYNGEELLGSLGPGSYLCWERDPGRLLARLILDRPKWDGGPIEQLYDAEIVAGEVSWVRVSFDQSELRLVPEQLGADAGRALVAESRAASVHEPE